MYWIPNWWNWKKFILMIMVLIWWQRRCLDKSMNYVAPSLDWWGPQPRDEFFLHPNKKNLYRNYPYMITGWRCHPIVNFFSNDNRMGVPSGSHFQIKMITGWNSSSSHNPNWKINPFSIWTMRTGWVSSGYHVDLEMKTRWHLHPVVNFFQMTTGWKCHSVVIQGHLRYGIFLLGCSKNLLGWRKNLSREGGDLLGWVLSNWGPITQMTQLQLGQQMKCFFMVVVASLLPPIFSKSRVKKWEWG